MKARVFRQQEGSAQWVQPFPEDYPSFEVEALDLGSIESGKVIQKYGAGGRNPGVVELMRANRALVSRSILNWRGEEKLVGDYADQLRAGAILKNGDVSLPFNEDNKQFFTALQFEEPDPNTGVPTFVSVHEYVMRALRADVETERKN